MVALIVFSATFSNTHKYMFCHHATKVSQAKKVKTLKNIARIAIMMQQYLQYFTITFPIISDSETESIRMLKNSTEQNLGLYRDDV